MLNETLLARLRRLDNLVARISLTAAALMLAVLVCAALWQVIARFALHVPQSWSEVTARTAMIWATFLAIGGSYHRGVMIAVDLVPSLLPARGKRVLDVVIFIGNVTVLGTLIWNGTLMAQRVAGQTLAGVNVSIAWGYAAIPTGCAIALVTVILGFLIGRSATATSPEVL